MAEKKPKWLVDQYLDEHFPLINPAIDRATELLVGGPPAIIAAMAPNSLRPVTHGYMQQIMQPEARIRRAFDDIGYGAFKPFPPGIDYNMLVALARKQAGY